MKIFLSKFICILTLLISQNIFAQATSDSENVDPWEGFNRKIYTFNDTLDVYFMKPVAKGYNYITPSFVNIGLSNMFSNIMEVRTSANSILQAKPNVLGNSLLRFVINSTVGVLGFFDVAAVWGFDEQKEDFGQTLAVWGVGSGPYLMLPFFGPSDLRDVGGLSVDLYTSPLNIDHVPTRNTVQGVRLIDTRADLIKHEDLISGDRYLFIRTAYLQNRNYLIHDGKVEDDFGEMESDDWDSSDGTEESVDGATEGTTEGESDSGDDWLE